MRKQFRVTKKSNLNKKSHTPSTDHSVANTSFNIASAESALAELNDIEYVGEIITHAAEHLHQAMESNQDVRRQLNKIFDANSSIMERSEEGSEIDILARQIDGILDHII